MPHDMLEAVKDNRERVTVTGHFLMSKQPTQVDLLAETSFATVTELYIAVSHYMGHELFTRGLTPH